MTRLREEQEMQDVLYFHVEELRKRARETLERGGVSPDISELVATVLVDADVRGHPSHGVALLPLYLTRLRQGGINAHAYPSCTELSETVTLLDGRGGFGQLSADTAARHCARSAARQGLAAVGVRGNNHIGMLAAYRQHFVASDVIGLLMNISGPSVSAPGAQRATLGNNAVCLIVPRQQQPPFIVDFATGVVACGKIRSAALSGRSVPPEWLLDRSGRPSTDPADLDRGGSVPVFGGHKGLGLSLMIEVLAGILVAGTVSPLVNRQRHAPGSNMGCSQLFLGFRSDLFGQQGRHELLDVICDAVRDGYDTSVPTPFFPEQREQACTEAAHDVGVPVPSAVAAELGWAAHF
uniref:Malate/L-lactate dehydrogenase n=1 Tax=Streptomyces sp. FR1 TaxID=349971 RepID=V9Z3H8_9ACTN|nr:Ldh family oxidoreductase [Streptomyces sp. FR1]AHE38683.1 Malate/L-lactate dehydrogenase [Streptomyces sp. FR1]